MNNTDKKLLVLGIGNLIMGDEGIGIHVIQQLEKETLPDFVACLDGGTGGFFLLEQMQEADRIVVIDAAAFNDDLGSIQVLRPQFSSQYPRTLTAHDTGLKDLLDWFNLMDHPVDIRLIAITISPHQTLEIGLTPPIEEAKNKALALIREEISLFQQEIFSEATE
jgi:hydrogenase maturation protease